MTNPETNPAQKTEEITLKSILDKSPVVLKKDWADMPGAGNFIKAAVYIGKWLTEKYVTTNPDFKISTLEIIKVIARMHYLDVKINGIDESQRYRYPELKKEREFLGAWWGEISGQLYITTNKVRTDARNAEEKKERVMVNPNLFLNGTEFFDMALTLVAEN